MHQPAWVRTEPQDRSSEKKTCASKSAPNASTRHPMEPASSRGDGDPKFRDAACSREDVPDRFERGPHDQRGIHVSQGLQQTACGCERRDDRQGRIVTHRINLPSQWRLYRPRRNAETNSVVEHHNYGPYRYLVRYERGIDE